MLSFYARPFVALSILVGRFEEESLRCEDGIDESGKKLLVQALDALLVHCKRLPLSDSLFHQIKRAREDVPRTPSRLTLVVILREVRLNIDQELSAWLFYAVPEKFADLMVDDAEPFGPETAARFPDATKDVLASGRCLALNEWTACVFHCMRVLENGLRVFAGYLGVTMTRPIELEEWKNILDAIEKEIRRLEALPKGTDKTERTQFYSEAASQFRYFKDAWRNHVSHSRVSYDSREAQVVWDHTKEFMQVLARKTNPPLPGTP